MVFANKHKARGSKLHERDMNVFTRVKFKNIMYYRSTIFTTTQHIRE